MLVSVYMCKYYVLYVDVMLLGVVCYVQMACVYMRVGIVYYVQIIGMCYMCRYFSCTYCVLCVGVMLVVFVCYVLCVMFCVLCFVYYVLCVMFCVLRKDVICEGILCYVYM